MCNFFFLFLFLLKILFYILNILLDFASLILGLNPARLGSFSSSINGHNLFQIIQMHRYLIAGFLFSLGYMLAFSNAAPTSILDIIYSGRAVPEAKHLIYARTPVSWILAARRFGKQARQNLTIELESDGLEGVEKFHLYADHLSKCSTVDQQFMGNAEEHEEQAEQNERGKLAAKFAMDLGLDEMTSNLFAMPAQARRVRIGSVCARNELRLQCALGFYRNQMNKLKEHIGLIKEQDGVFKVMLETECQHAAKELDSEEFLENSVEIQPLRLNSIFQCVHEKSVQLGENCAASLNAYNSSRRQINSRIHEALESAISVLQRRLERATEGGEEAQVEKALRNGEAFLKRTLTQSANFEASKCRRFKEMLQCLNTNIQEICGEHSANELSTMLKNGYLRRERGDFLHAQFTELAVETGEDCLSAISTTSQ